MKTIIGVFDNPSDARRALETLRDGPLMLDDVSFMSRDHEARDDNPQDVSAGEGAAVGAVWGGLVGLAALLIPGIGPFVAGGALFAALTGAVTGAVVGGISAALIDFSGIPEDEARGYESDINAGKTLVAVKAQDEDAAEVHRILSMSGADQVRGDQAATAGLASAPARVMMYDDQGQRVEQTREVGSATRSYGIYDYPATATSQANQTSQAGQSWTSGEVIGETQGAGRRTNTGKYDADQWVGEGQGPGETPGDTWTSGQVVGEGQGRGPHTDTGEYDAKQWVGEGQGDKPVTDDTPKRVR